MGYGISTNLLYGVELAPTDAAKLHAFIQSHIDEEEDDLDSWLGELDMDMVMIAQDTDSRIHNTMYQEGFRHFFGVLLARKGYGGGSDKKFAQALNDTHHKASDTFHRLAQPLLDQAGVKAIAGVQMATYMA